MNNIVFNNEDLTIDIEKIVSFDTPITVSKECDDVLDYPFAIDVEDKSYWYANQEDRDEDFDKLESIVPYFSFIYL